MPTVILASHGTSDAVGAGLISQLVQAVAARLPGHSVLEAFVDVQQPQVPEVLAQALSKDTDGPIIMVPLLLSTGFHVRQDITDAAAAVELSADPSGNSATQILVTPALGPSQQLVDLLKERLLEADWTPKDTAILAVAGSSDAAAVEECRLVHLQLAESLQEADSKATLEIAFLSAAEPKLKDLVPRLKFAHPRKRVVVANYLLAPGYFDTQANKAGAHVVAQPLLSPNAPIPEQLVSVVLQRIADALAGAGTLGCLAPPSASWSCAAGCSLPCR